MVKLFPEQVAVFTGIWNYLFVIMKFSQSPEDKRQWMSIFEIYKNRIYKAEIRKKGDEQKEYDDHYDKLRAEKHQAKIF